jgi:hypothetical protein
MDRSHKVSYLKISIRAAGAALAGLAIAGCGGNAASPEGAVTVVQPSTTKAQIVVGTANIFGTKTGMNVVATLRTPAGSSVLLTTPSISGSFTLPAIGGTPDGSGSTLVTGPSPYEIRHSGMIGATPQVAPGTTTIAPSTFGVDVGLFANGFLPANADNRGDVVDTPDYQPFYDPANATLLSTGAIGDPNSFIPWGGPPAFDPNKDNEGTRDGTFDPSVVGVNEGLNIFQGVTPRAGAYALNVVIPTNNGNTTITAATTLPAAVALGTVTAPAFVPDGAGGGKFNVVLPAGANDGLLQIVDLGPVQSAATGAAGYINCYTNGSFPAYFTVHVTGTGTYALPDLDGVGSPTKHNPTICTAAQNAAVAANVTAVASNAGGPVGGDQYTVQLIGADYPLYASNYLFNLGVQLPAIAGSRGSDDITISPILAGTST